MVFFFKLKKIFANYLFFPLKSNTSLFHRPFFADLLHLPGRRPMVEAHHPEVDGIVSGINHLQTHQLQPHVVFDLAHRVLDAVLAFSNLRNRLQRFHEE